MAELLDPTSDQILNILGIGSPIRGDILTVDSTPKYIKLAIGATDTLLISDGTDLAYSKIANANLNVGIFANITGIGVQTQSLNMGGNTIININATNKSSANIVFKDQANTYSGGGTQNFQTAPFTNVGNFQISKTGSQIEVDHFRIEQITGNAVHTITDWNSQNTVPLTIVMFRERVLINDNLVNAEKIIKQYQIRTPGAPSTIDTVLAFDSSTSTGNEPVVGQIEWFAQPLTHESGTKINGPIFDNAKTLRIAYDMVSAPSGALLGTEQILSIVGSTPTGLTTTFGYQKTGLIVHLDTGNSQNGQTGGLVAIDGRAIITNETLDGRVFTLSLDARVTAGGDGDAFVFEGHMVDDSTVAQVQTPGSPLNKIGMKMITKGTQDATAAIQIAGTAGSTWFHGIWLDPVDITTGGAFLTYLGQFVVQQDGTVDMFTNTLTNVGDITSITNLNGVAIGDYALATGDTYTGAHLFNAATMRIPLSATPTIAVDGDFAIDTTITDFSMGLIKYFDGEEMVVVAVPIAELTTPSDGQAVTYNATTDEFELRTPSGSGDMVLASVQTVTGAKTFEVGTFLLRNPADTFSLTVDAGTQTAARTVTFPVLGGSDTIATLGVANVFTATQETTGNLVPFFGNRTGADTSQSRTVLRLKHTTTAEMVDGFGVTLTVDYEDATSGNLFAGNIGWSRDGADNDTKVTFAVNVAGTPTVAFTLDSNLQAIFAGDVNIGTNRLIANAGTMRIPLSATPTMAVDGDFAIDTDLGVDFSHGFIKYFDGEEIVVVAMPVAEFTSPVGGTVVSYNATTNEFELVVAGAGDMILASIQTVTGAKTFGTIGGAVGKFILAGSTSGSTIVNAAAIAGSTTMTLPGTTSTLVGIGIANQLTNTELTAGAFAKITGVGTIATGTWEGIAVASAFLDADTAHLTTTQIFTGTKTFDLVASITSSAANPAAGGFLNLANTQRIEWKNSTNDADITLAVNSNDQLELTIQDGKISQGFKIQVGATSNNVIFFNAIGTAGRFKPLWTYTLGANNFDFLEYSVKVKNDNSSTPCFVLNGSLDAGGALVNKPLIDIQNNGTTLFTFGLAVATFADAYDIAFNATTGTKIGTATTQKLAFWNVTPVVQPVHIADPTGGATVDAEARTAINSILAQMATTGMQAAT